MPISFVSKKCPNVKHCPEKSVAYAYMMQEQLRGSGEVGARASRQRVREVQVPWKRAEPKAIFARDSLVHDLVVKPTKQFVRSILPPEWREALRIRATEPLDEHKSPHGRGVHGRRRERQRGGLQLHPSGQAVNVSEQSQAGIPARQTRVVFKRAG
jgi:hypothetical protein